MNDRKLQTIIRSLVVMSVLSFLGAGIARSISGTTTIQHPLNGIVGVMGGIFACSLALAALLEIYRKQFVAASKSRLTTREILGLPLLIVIFLVGIWMFVLGTEELVTYWP